MLGVVGSVNSFFPPMKILKQTETPILTLDAFKSREKNIPKSIWKYANKCNNNTIQ